MGSPHSLIVVNNSFLYKKSAAVHFALLAGSSSRSAWPTDRAAGGTINHDGQWHQHEHRNKFMTFSYYSAVSVSVVVVALAQHAACQIGSDGSLIKGRTLASKQRTQK